MKAGILVPEAQKILGVCLGTRWHPEFSEVGATCAGCQPSVLEMLGAELGISLLTHRGLSSLVSLLKKEGISSTLFLYRNKKNIYKYYRLL